MSEETKNLTINNEAEMSDEEFRSLYMETLENLQEDKIVKGKILSILDNEVLIDIGYKSEGIIPLSEFRNMENLQVGDQVDVFFEATEDQDGIVVLSKQKADRILGWEKIISSCEEGKVVEGRVVRKVKGGLIVDIGMDAFLPASQVDIKPLRDVILESYIGNTYKFKVIKINPDRKNIVLSRRELLEEVRKGKRQILLGEIEVGQWRKGVVKNLTDFGAFIDLDGMDGLLHITDISWGKIGHPSEVLSLGDEIDVLILDFDTEKERVSLGLKQKTPDPWEQVVEKYPKGDVIKGRVVNIMPYGAFVELEKGIEGLIHISELSWTKRINHPSEVLSVGEIVETMVLVINKESRKLSLGLKQTGDNPWDQVVERFPEGKKAKGVIRNLTTYGAFVELDDGIDGLIHVSDISWTKKINNPSEVLTKGDEIETIILNVDKDNKKIALGLKQLQPDPWETIAEKYKSGQIMKATVNKITGFGVFMILEEGIEGLVHVSQISDKPFNKIEEIIKDGDTRNVMILKVEPESRKIALSLKDVAQDDIKEEKPKKVKKEKNPSKDTEVSESDVEKTKDKTKKEAVDKTSETKEAEETASKDKAEEIKAEEEPTEEKTELAEEKMPAEPQDEAVDEEQTQEETKTEEIKEKEEVETEDSEKK
ncbi:MAG: 30S ribosomal protein S1 [Candidatus Theseobacter exili]|nr:30S ribosomal protein S1 [Candidatus Theseobacter exili]